MDLSEQDFRSPELMNVQDTVLLVIDMQKKILPLVRWHEQVEHNVGRLIEAARILGLKVLVTEQYPKGLGPTVETLRRKLPEEATDCFEKTAFSCCGADGFRSTLRELKPANILVCGIESHVCVLQTAMDLLADGFRVYLAVDAMGARHEIDHETAIKRLESQGAALTTTEMSLFEWCRTASSPQFKAIQQLILS